jgi:hypothetical protein
MPTIKVSLVQETYERLTAQAIKERRPVPWQAEVIIRDALLTPEERIRCSHRCCLDRLEQPAD